MDDIVQIDNRWYVLATSSRADDRTRVLKHGETFGLFDRYGDIHHLGLGEQGLYHRGTRFLSHFDLRINDARPLLLNSTVKQDNSLLVVDLTTPDLYESGALHIRKSTLHLFRAKLLHGGVHYEHLRLVNYDRAPVNIRLSLHFGADFADIFEVRGVERRERGRSYAPEYDARSIVLGYEGLDNVFRRTRIAVEQMPDRIEGEEMHYDLQLGPGGQRDIYVTVACEIGEERPTLLTYDTALHRAEEDIQRTGAATSEMCTSNEQFNDWLDRSIADLQMLITRTPRGPYPYAGVPWFSTPFGRDGIVTAMQMLWLDPSLARGVLAFLAAEQASNIDAAEDAEPGKIIHEMRDGELARLGEVPFGRYYGSVDATPLFVMLAGEYYDRTGDTAFIRTLWPHIERALAWIDEYGDADRDGFVEYARHSPNGLVHQGWKDSEDAVFHADGTLACAPIALCEVQGYVYAARRTAARLARLLGKAEQAQAYERAAQVIKEKFNRTFWCEDLGAFALALDGEKRLCHVAASNAGYALYTGIAEPDYARRTAELLVSPAFYTGWGMRTVARGERRYNPMSYHNGSVWPHDNGLVALGFARYGFKEHAVKLLGGLFDASIALDLHRLPELYCGFERLPGQGPTLYPVACLPQAWASGAVFHLLQACLGVSFSPEKPQMRFNHPWLPEYLQWIEIKNLRFRDGSLDLVIRRHLQDVSVNVLRKDGGVEVAITV
ncbi:MAG: glycogen debranching N-terminal domain-containing protein [Sulfurifustis sp.]